ncbi:MAG TPA: hypothetical protein PKV55_13005, partial [Nitrospira sp.]|nr:hypothetical protein [Nitrospira sp.]
PSSFGVDLAQISPICAFFYLEQGFDIQAFAGIESAAFRIVVGPERDKSEEFFNENVFCQAA